MQIDWYFEGADDEPGTEVMQPIGSGPIALHFERVVWVRRNEENDDVECSSTDPGAKPLRCEELIVLVDAATAAKFVPARIYRTSLDPRAFL